MAKTDDLVVEGFGKLNVVICGSHHGRILHQRHVVPAQSHDEQHGPDVLEAADPLPPLRPLASNVIQPAEETQDKRNGDGDHLGMIAGGMMGGGMSKSTRETDAGAVRRELIALHT